MSDLKNKARNKAIDNIDYMERLYRIYPWPEDPYTDTGLRRFEESVNVFKSIVMHEWFKDLIKGKSKLNIIDLCGGTGIGGIALSKVIVNNLKLDVELTIVDLRKSALDVAEKFAKDILGRKIKVLVHDVREEFNVESYYDIALLWGFTTPHFSPWDFIKVLANTAKILKHDSLFMYDEIDRVYTIFYLTGYKEVLPEASNDKLVLTLHKGREFKTGYMIRLAVDLLAKDYVEMKTYFWDLASSAALTWFFFEDVDFIPINRPYKGIIMARKPRKNVDLSKFARSKPKLL